MTAGNGRQSTALVGIAEASVDAFFGGSEASNFPYKGAATGSDDGKGENRARNYGDVAQN